MKLLNVLLITAIVLTGLGIASAQPITAYSVTGVKTSTATDLGVTSYTATVSTSSNKGSKSGILPNGTAITINAVSCTHVPGKSGENGTIVVNGAVTTLLFESGATCAVKSVVPQI
jgi:formylmethanofuran dehydrogenase subunit C